MRTDCRIRFAAGGFALTVLTVVSSLRLLFPLQSAAADAIAERRSAILATQCGGQSVQQWADSTLADGAGKGTAEWYVTALAVSGETIDFSAYLSALEENLRTGSKKNATAKQRCALAMAAASKSLPQECETLLAESIGQQGIMSLVFGLHLISNGIPSTVSPAEAAGGILAEQCADGGWSVRGDYGDPDVTAMTLQALAPYRTQQSVQEAIGRGIAFLSQKQLDDGGYSSFGTENPESAAQVWIALAALNISPLSDARFVKNGHTLLDAISLFDLGGGQYAHLPGGDANANASVQVFLALTAHQLYESGKSFYRFRGALPAWESAQQQQTALPVTDAPPVRTTKTTAASESSRTAGTVTGTQQSRSAASSSATDTAVSGTTLTAAISADAETATGEQPTASAAAPDTSRHGTETETTASSAEHTAHGAAEQTAAESPQQEGSFAYRIPATAVLWGIFAVICVILRLKKRRSAKTYLTLAALFALLTAGLWLLNFRTPAQYYQAQSRSGGGTVTMEIRCDVICGMPGSERFPADGVILPKTEFSIAENENALTLLYDAVRANALQIEVDGISGDVVETAYVRGIASLYEFDFGDLSGWTYKVNGERPPVGCGAFTLHDGDQVVWEYTIDL